ncbi:MAG: DUF4416 family protein [Deferribacteres bacterium]|nr:DUF4416 family protein [candidate division KSB1 bacterium]MCB9508626.1 DUF4416 family protein [Deferribacteres bacterium]
MATPGKPDEALLFIAFSFQRTIALPTLQDLAIAPFGQVWQQSAPFAFAYSQYYAQEMGPDLLKMFVVYDQIFDIEQAVAMKMRAIEIEQATSENGNRTINIDPGYVTLAKLVLTTTKNFDHRIHIGAGIFADVQLRFRNGEYVTNSWTYPDYREKQTFDFLKSARSYLHQLVKQHEANLQSGRR